MIENTKLTENKSLLFHLNRIKKEKDKKRLSDLLTKLEKTTILDVIGASFVSKGITPDIFNKSIKDSDISLSIGFKCSVINGMENHAIMQAKKPTANELIELINEISIIITK